MQTLGGPLRAVLKAVCGTFIIGLEIIVQPDKRVLTLPASGAPASAASCRHCVVCSADVKKGLLADDSKGKAFPVNNHHRRDAKTAKKAFKVLLSQRSFKGRFGVDPLEVYELVDRGSQ